MYILSFGEKRLLVICRIFAVKDKKKMGWGRKRDVMAIF